jgi:hypothetical protein
MSIPAGFIRKLHHACFPSSQDHWLRIQQFWESLGLDIRERPIEDEDYDHAAPGNRLQVCANGQVLVSYYVLFGVVEDMLHTQMRRQHLALSMAAPGLETARIHPKFERETHWGHGRTSVFLRGPYGLHVELVTVDPGYHDNNNA